MRIADVAEFYAEAGGGVKTYIEAKLAAGAAAGIEVHVVAPGPKDDREARAGGWVHWVKSPPVPGDPRYFLFTSKPRVHEVLARIQPDVVEGSSPYGGAWFASSWPHAKVRAQIFHQDPVAALAHPLLDRHLPAARIDGLAAPVWAYLRRLGARFDTTVVAGAWLATRLRGFGLPRVDAVPFGIDPAPFRDASRSPELRAEWRARLGLGERARILVAVSRHHPEKRLPTIIEAVGRLPEAVGLVVFGDGPARKQVERAAERVPNVHLAGYTRDRAALATAIASSDGFLHGSAAETYGLVVSEALAAGVPIIVPSAGGAGELARAEYAETYTPGDVSDCAAALERFLARDEAGMRRAAEEAGRSVRTLDSHFRDLFSHYEALMRTQV